MDGFYDIGYAGSNLENVGVFPTLSKLSALPVDKKREVVLIDNALDPALQSVGNYLADAISGLNVESQIRLIALAVSKLLGGPVDPDNLSQYNFKFKISETKLKLGSNVIPIGQIHQGTFYHRALLFKALADRVGMKPCSLVRGEYNRAWNIIDVKNVTVNTPRVVPAKRVPSSKPKHQDKNQPAPAPVPTLSQAEQKALYIGQVEGEAKAYSSEEAAIVDLMFEPGKLLPLNSSEAIAYQRHYASL